MRTFILSIALFTLTLLPSLAKAQQNSNRFVSIIIPQEIIVETLDKIMPLTLDESSTKLEGSITIEKISDVKIVQGKILCRLYLHGENLNLLTEIANQTVRLKLGSTKLDFACQTDIRFDPSTQTLFLRPVSPDLEDSDPLKDGDIGKTLLAFLNGREFPLPLQKIDPIITETANKLITVQTAIADIKAVQNNLLVYLKPDITTTANALKK